MKTKALEKLSMYWSQTYQHALAVTLSLASISIYLFLQEPIFLILAIITATLGCGWQIGMVVAVSLAALTFFAPDTGSNGLEARSMPIACVTAWMAVTIMGLFGRAHQLRLVANHNQLPTNIAESSVDVFGDAVPARIWSLNASGKLTHVSQALMDWQGVSADDFKGKQTSLVSNFLKDIHPEDQQAVLTGFERAFRTGTEIAMKYRKRYRDGSHRWIDTRFRPKKAPDARIEAWFGVDVDVDDVVRANELLQRSETELELILDTVPAQIWLLAPDGCAYFFNRTCSEWLGIKQDVILGMEAAPRKALIESYFHKDDLPSVQAALYKAFESLEPMHVKFRLRRKDGEYRWVDFTAAAMRDEEGVVVRWYGISYEIEEEIRAAEALQRNEQHLQRVIDTVPVVLMQANSAGEPIYANMRFKEEFGYELAEFGSVGEDRRGTTLQTLVHPDDKLEVEQAMGHSFETGEPFRRRYRKLGSAGKYRWIEARIEPLLDADGNVVEWYGVNLDVDDEVQAQENLRLAQGKLARAVQAASMAQLSASIAQEVHEPLAAIAANARACERWLSTGAPNLIKARETAEEVIRDTESVSESINRIRSLFKSSARSSTSANINDLVDGRVQASK